MKPPLLRAFIDETGNVALSRHQHILVVAALGMENSHAVARLMRGFQKKVGASLASGELKAKKAQDKFTRELLEALSREAIEIFAVIVDRSVIEHPPKDPEDIYRWAVARLVKKLVRRTPHLEVVLDRRHTKELLRDQLEYAIREEISDLPQQVVLIRQEDSTLSSELQAVDFIAWALFQKHERGNDSFQQLIAGCIIEEELVTKQVWESG